jgi:signal transduction histidine kinase
VYPSVVAPAASRRELAAENIVVRIRWFGLLVGYALVNLLEAEARHRSALNGILTLGLAYAVLDTVWSLRGRVFLSRSPLAVALMETVFISLLCFFDQGIESPFRFYYFLSLVCTAIRYQRAITYTTCLLHGASYSALLLGPGSGEAGPATPVLTLIVMGWVTWASTSLAALLKRAEEHLRELNQALQDNQAQLEQRIRQRTWELQQAQASLLHQEKMAAFGLLAAGIAHEVGNPLTSISSLVQMLQRRHRDRYTQEKLALVGDQLTRIQGTLRELVDFSRPSPRHESWVSIRETLDAALNIAKYYKRTEGKVIQTQYDDALPLLRATRDQLVQVFLNLVLNAIDATRKGGHIRIAASKDADHVAVRISDDGTGIRAADCDRVFEPYFTTKEFGTGLGLFVSRNLVAEMGGRLLLETTSRDGTTFRVELPLAKTAATPVPQAEEVCQTAEAVRRPARRRQLPVPAPLATESS